MTDLPLCPTCSEPLTKVGAFLVCPKHGLIPQTRKEQGALRIFLSYGHDDNEELVRYISTDLEERGHDVWFDQSEIRFGDDWRREITKGILKSDRVLSFLSKHSTRDPGVCRDEISIALGVKGGDILTILVENENEVQPPVNIGHVQWLDMGEWKSLQTSARDKWKVWYKSKLDQIISVIESDESRRFAGEIEKLKKYLSPINSNARISSLLNKGFIGREWLFEAVEKWRIDRSQTSRLFWITGDPGFGKSAFAAQLMHTRSDVVIAAQFVEWDKPDHKNSANVIRSIAFQIATRLPDYRKFLLTLPEISNLQNKKATELFDYLLANPLNNSINGGRERYLIVIDALDEAGDSDGNSLVELLARDAKLLPDWLGIVITSRPESAIKSPLLGLIPLFLDATTKDNSTDISNYLKHHLDRQLRGRSNSKQIIQKILKNSEGIILYAEQFCEDIWNGHISLNHPEQFPLGLGGIYFNFFKRQFPILEKFREEVRPALRAVLAAREPLPLELLKQIFDWSDEELQDFVRCLGSVFKVTEGNESKTIKLYHKALYDWITDEAMGGVYFVSVIEGHRVLADLFWSKYALGVDKLSEYALRHALFHFNILGFVDKINRMGIDPKFLQRRDEIGLSQFYLSYSRHDKEFVMKISKDLAMFGISMWLDEKALEPGMEWREVILEGIFNNTESTVGGFNLVVAFLSKHSVNEKGFCLNELENARNSGMPTFPVIVDDCEIPSHLAGLQLIDMQGWESSSSIYNQGLSSLVRLLDFVRAPTEY